jgi:hypothetical protein
MDEGDHHGHLRLTSATKKRGGIALPMPSPDFARTFVAKIVNSPLIDLNMPSFQIFTDGGSEKTPSYT